MRRCICTSGPEQPAAQLSVVKSLCVVVVLLKSALWIHDFGSTLLIGVVRAPFFSMNKLTVLIETALAPFQCFNEEADGTY